MDSTRSTLFIVLIEFFIDREYSIKYFFGDRCFVHNMSKSENLTLTRYWARQTRTADFHNVNVTL